MDSRKLLPTHQDFQRLVLCRIRINGFQVHSDATVEMDLSIQAHTMEENKIIHVFFPG
jgi:hypothetical protein